MAKLTDIARSNRKNPTDAEKKLYYALRDLKIGRFQRQFPINDKYIADLIWRKKRIIIECDGGQHHTSDGLEYDFARTEFIQRQGYTVMRFDNDDIIKNINGVLYEICKDLGIEYKY
jgi:very-short-patch-repair endonuclease